MTPAAQTAVTTELIPGAGVAVRSGGIALVAFPDASADGTVGTLVDLVDSVVGDATAPPGPRLARRLAGLLSGEQGDRVPAFGFVGEADGGQVVFLYGAVVADIDGDEPQQLSGAQSATWVDRVLTAGVRSVRLTRAGADDAGGPTPFRLGSGVVPAGGLTVRLGDPGAAHSEAPAAAGGVVPPAPAPPAEPAPAPAPAPPPMPERDSAGESEPPTEAMPVGPPEDPPAAVPVASAAPGRDVDPSSGFQSISLRLPAEELPVREPLPVEGEAPAAPAEAETEATGGAEIQGIVCSRGHFNNPASSYCSVCGISMVHQTHNLVRGTRPPLGFLVFDDGATYSLDHPYVIGREPDDDEKVRSGEARPLVIDDPDRSISRVHAEVVLDGWDVRIADRGSTNGTYVWDASQERWEPVSADRPVMVQPATRLAVGQRTFVFETPHKGR